MRLKIPRFRRRQPHSDTVTVPSGVAAIGAQETLSSIGDLLRRQREEAGLSLRDLANETRITTPVLEALERGWRDRLPERTYLASMLPRLEDRLGLPAGSLEPVLPPRSASRQMRTGAQLRFTPGSIDVFTTWQGTVVYAVVITASVLALNRQQQQLAISNSLSLQPVRLALSDGGGMSASDDDPAVSGLRPLQRVRDQGLQHWLQSSDRGGSQGSVGVLEVTLSQPRTLQVSSRGGDRLDLKGSAGKLTLQLLAPVQLTISPPPASEDRILWNGQAQQSDAKRKGFYRLSDVSRKPEAPSLERPQTAPRSP